MNLSRVTRTRYRTKRDEPGGVRKLSKCKKIYPRLAANGARVATREAREGQKLHILPFFFEITCTQTNEYTKLVQYYWYIHYTKTQRRTVCWTTSGPFRH